MIENLFDKKSGGARQFLQSYKASIPYYLVLKEQAREDK